MKKLILSMVLAAGFMDAYAFCGFYVAKAGASLFNNKSQVIIVRDGTKTTITMSNDYQGDAKDFAMVVPVPEVLRERDIKLVGREIFEKLDAYSAPRLVEYYDHNPCWYAEEMSWKSKNGVSKMAMAGNEAKYDEDETKVKIEAQYSIGEYDILLLSAEESKGLKTWLIANGYKIPEGAEEVLEPYIKSNLKFFVVKVNLAAREKSAYNYLRPIQITFNSPKFMLPIRLGMANSQGEQDMIVYAFSKQGAVEVSNYRTVKMSTARNIPTFTKDIFDKFYVDLFSKAYRNEGRNAVFTEYAWDVTPNYGIKCDPCVGPPPILDDLREAGVDWVNSNSTGSMAFFTRLHVRYSREKFPQDLLMLETPNTEQFQARYIITHPATGAMECEEGKKYLENLGYRRSKELMELEALTGWDAKMYESYLDDGDINNGTKKGAIPVVYVPGNNNQKPNTTWPYLLGAIGFTLLLMLTARLKPKTV